MLALEQGRFELEKALLSLDRLSARELMRNASAAHAPAALAEALIAPTLEHLGAAWQQGTVALSQVYMAGRICEELVDEFFPKDAAERRAGPRMAITVLEDHHELGKRIVYSLLRASGFECADYRRQTVAECSARVAGEGIELLLVSTLMLPSALKVRSLRERLAAVGCGAKIAVGGAPFRLDSELWKEVGADATGATASDALALAARFSAEGAR